MQISKMKHAVITRLHYPEGHPDFVHRLDYYKKEVFPRLMMQTDQNFDIWLWVEPHHEKQVKFHPRINTFQVDCEVRKNKYGHFIDHTEWAKVKGLPKYDIQTGLDSDDLVVPDFIEKIHSICKGEKSILISFQPVKLDVNTGYKYEMIFCGNKREYNKKNGTSPIFSIYQPNKRNFLFAYEHDHIILHNYFDKTELVNNMVYMSIHNMNDSTRIKPNEKRIIGNMDVVYPLKNGDWFNRDIAYSIASLKFINYNKIVIIGRKYPCDLHIQVEDQYSRANQNVIHKLLMACYDSRISDDFILMNDDFYFLTHQNIKTYTCKTLQDEINRRKNDKYSFALKEAIDILGYNGKNYEIHYPIIINKKKFIKTFEDIDWENRYLVWRSVYGNINKIPSVEVSEDFKFYNEAEFNKKKDTFFISSPPNAANYLDDFLRDVFGKIEEPEIPKEFKFTKRGPRYIYDGLFYKITSFEELTDFQINDILRTAKSAGMKVRRISFSNKIEYIAK